MTKTSAASGLFPLILCMWSDHDTIQPHAKYQRRERPGDHLRFCTEDLLDRVLTLENISYCSGGSIQPWGLQRAMQEGILG
jgi:hypothetical protein